jgi:hypothetical protein
MSVPDEALLAAVEAINDLHRKRGWAIPARWWAEELRDAVAPLIAAAERERIRQLAKRESFTLYRPGNGPGAGQQALEVVPLAVLMQDQP